VAVRPQPGHVPPSKQTRKSGLPFRKSGLSRRRSFFRTPTSSSVGFPSPSRSSRTLANRRERPDPVVRHPGEGAVGVIQVPAGVVEDPAERLVPDRGRVGVGRDREAEEQGGSVLALYPVLVEGPAEPLDAFDEPDHAEAARQPGLPVRRLPGFCRTRDVVTSVACVPGAHFRIKSAASPGWLDRVPPVFTTGTRSRSPR
jgi:hypothetical protein